MKLVTACARGLLPGERGAPESRRTPAAALPSPSPGTVVGVRARWTESQRLRLSASFPWEASEDLPGMGQKALSGWRGAMSRFLNVLRSWLVMTSVIAMGYSLQGFRDHTFLYEKLYTSKPDLVNGLQARTFGVWMLLSSVIRGLCAIDIHNKRLYYITLLTFFIAMGHIVFELFVFRTGTPTIGTIAPLMVASISILGMLVGLWHLEAEPGSKEKKRN